MCYALPGPRCSNHCFNDLAKARTAYFEAVEKVGGDEKSRAKFEAAKERYERAQARFDRSPEGQRLLREEAAALRPTDPERADALEALANEGAKAHKFEVGAHKKKTLVEQQAFERLHEEAMQTGEEAERIADQIAEGAEGADRERLAALQGRVRELTAQYSTTPMGLQRIRAGIKSLKDRYDAAETDEQRAALKRGIEFRVNHFKESKEARARMLAEYHAKTKAREQADAFMKEARETGGLKALDAKRKPEPQPSLIMTSDEERLSRQLNNPNSKHARRLSREHPNASPALLHSLREHENPSVRSQVINHPNTSKATLVHMLDRTRSGSEATAIVKRGVLTADDERRIVNDPDEPDSFAAYGVAAAGRDPEALRTVSEEYGKRVTYNPHAPGSLLKDLVHESPINVSQHPNATRETLESIARNPDYVTGARVNALSRLRGVSEDKAREMLSVAV